MSGMDSFVSQANTEVNGSGKACTAAGGVLLRVESKLILFRVSQKLDFFLSPGPFRWSAEVTLGIFTRGRQMLSFRCQLSLSLLPRLASWIALLWNGSWLPAFCPGGSSRPTPEPAWTAKATSPMEGMLCLLSAVSDCPFYITGRGNFSSDPSAFWEVCLQAPCGTLESQGHLLCKPG